jgi:hypothetical protein
MLGLSSSRTSATVFFAADLFFVDYFTRVSAFCSGRPVRPQTAMPRIPAASARLIVARFTTWINRPFAHPVWSEVTP